MWQTLPEFGTGVLYAILVAAAYTFAIPWVRTLAFAVGFFAQAAIAWQILAR